MANNHPHFWLVWCEDGGSPTVKHNDYERAKREAQRLARANPGCRFVVLAAAIGFEVDDLKAVHYRPEVVNLLDEEIPF